MEPQEKSLVPAEVVNRLPTPLLRRIYFHLIPLLWIGYVFCIIDRCNIAYAEVQMETQLPLSPSAFGLAGGVFFFAYGTMQVPGNHMVHHIGARRVLAIVLTLWGFISTGMALVHDETTLCILRFFLGLAESTYFPGCVLYISKWIPESSEGEAMAILFTAAGVGSLLGNASSGFIMDGLGGVFGLEGWRWLFIAQGLPVLLLGPFVLLLLPNLPEGDVTWLTSAEHDLLLSELARKSSRTEHVPLCKALRSVLFNRKTWPFAIQYFSSAAGTYTCLFFLPLQLREVFPTMALWELGLLAGVPTILILLLGPPVAAWADRGQQPRRFRTSWCGCALSQAMILAAGISMLYLDSQEANMQHQSSVAILVVIMVSYSTAGMFTPSFWALHNSQQPEALRPVSIAVVNSIGNLGGFVGPFMLGSIHDTLGPKCPPHSFHGCTAQWGWGTTILSSGCLCLTATTGIAIRYLRLERSSQC